MKCPKCHYLGFDTGDRCKHCGYDFSLLALADSPALHGDLMLRNGVDRSAAFGAGPWADLEIDPHPGDAPPSIERTSPTAVEAGAAVRRSHDDTVLPLFSRQSSHDDEPLIKVPSSPRPPLAVRRTPETPRLRPPLSTIRPIRESEPALEFPEPIAVPAVVAPAVRTGVVNSAARLEASGAAARAAAALIDAAMLGAIDLAVLYFTLAMAGLPMHDWRVLPLAPLVAFLMLVKLAYYAVFTAFGGQTIGKMAAHIRVVSDDDGYLAPARAVQRTLAALGSVLTLGAGFIPALFTSGGRALHDRVAHTRVVAVPSS